MKNPPFDSLVWGSLRLAPNTLQKRFGTKDNSVRCSEFRGGRFLEVANVLQVWNFQSVTRTLSALGSVSASRSVCSGCSTVLLL